MSCDRPETGPMKFGEDWPGVFIRGDNAMYMSAALGMLLKVLRDHKLPEEVDLTLKANGFVVNWIKDVLDSCLIHPDIEEKETTKLKDFKECIDETE